MDVSDPPVLFYCAHCREPLAGGASMHDPARACVQLTICPECWPIVHAAERGIPAGVRLLGRAKAMMAGSGGHA